MSWDIDVCFCELAEEAVVRLHFPCDYIHWPNVVLDYVVLEHVAEDYLTLLCLRS